MVHRPAFMAITSTGGYDATKMVLSPSAQVIWDAWNDAYEAQGPLEGMDQPLAAALRAAADQARRTVVTGTPSTDWSKGWRQGAMDVADGFLGIAAELEGVQP
jgi:hypothetical protein